MNRTKIEWCDCTWNPATGCYHKCEYCYADKIARRFGAHIKDEESAESGRNSCVLHIIDNAPFSPGGNTVFPYDFEPTLYRYRMDEPAKKKKPQNIFVCSMADLFGKWIPDEWIEEVFNACEKAPQHRYLFLTKNPVRYSQLIRAGKLPRRNNIWYGTTVTDAKYMPDAFRCANGEYNAFVSMEPMLKHPSVNYYDYSGIKWFIMGAETGNRKEKVTPKKEWIGTTSEIIKDHGGKIFLKNSLHEIIGDENIVQEFPWS